MPWTWSALDQFATDISKLTEVTIPELVHEQSEFWSANLFLNSMLRAAWDPPLRELFYTLVRRVSSAYEEYNLAREATQRFVTRRSQGEQPTSVYFSALHHWEQCAALGWQAIDAWRTATGELVFTKGDGSAAERLNLTYNRSKHTDKAINSKQIPDGGPLAMWLSNEGLRTTDSLLTWPELHNTLVDLGEIANRVSDPTSFHSEE